MHDNVVWDKLTRLVPAVISKTEKVLNELVLLVKGISRQNAERDHWFLSMVYE